MTSQADVTGQAVGTPRWTIRRTSRSARFGSAGLLVLAGFGCGCGAAGALTLANSLFIQPSPAGRLASTVYSRSADPTRG